jgi:TP901 family phage tail tape measure protein
MTAEARITAKDSTGRVFNDISQKIDAVSKAAHRANAASNTTAARTARVLDHQMRQADRIGSAVNGALVAGASRVLAPAAVGYGIKLATDQAISLERTMIGVGKATNASGDDLKAYEKSVLDLSRATGKTKEEIGSIMAAAAFAGRPTQDLTRYTEYAAKATAAWATSAEETGQALAEIANTYKASQSRLEEIGDAINYVADNAAARESDLIEFIRRSGAAGDQAGLSAEQTIAFGAAMKEVGVNTEVAANTFNSLMNMMALGDEFLDSSKEGFAALGLNAAKVQKEFAKKPLETTVKLLERLAKIEDPIKAAEIRTALFGKEYQDNIAILSNNLSGLAKALGLVGDRSKYAGSVYSNFTTSINSDVGKLDRAARSLEVLGVRTGNAFKGIAGAVAEEINKAVDKIERGETILDRLEAQRRARDVAAGRDPDAATKALEAEAKEQLEAGARIRELVFGDKDMTLQRWIFPTQEDMRKAVRSAVAEDRTSDQRRAADLQSRLGKMNDPNARVPADVKNVLQRELAQVEARLENRRLYERRGMDDQRTLDDLNRRIEYAQNRPDWGGFGRAQGEGWKGSRPLATDGAMPGGTSAGTVGFGDFGSLLNSLTDIKATVEQPIDVTGKVDATVQQPVPVDVTGKVDAEVKGAATVNVRVQVEGGGRVTGMSAQSSGTIQANVGTSMPHIKAGPR